MTGAGHGIGAAVAQMFAARGDDVIVTDVDAEAAAKVAQLITSDGGMASAHRLDVASQSDWDSVAHELEGMHRLPSVVVNNAFRNVVAPAHELDSDGWESTLSVTLTSVYRSVRTFHDALVRNRGCLVNVSSVHALMAWAGHPAYAAAKGGMVALTRQLSMEYAPHVRVNAVLPGSIQTRVWDTVDAVAHAAAVKQSTLGRLGTPEEVASVVCFLASDEASYVTGIAVPVDGGQTSTVSR